MLRLTALLGVDVRSSRGQPIGSLRDVGVGLHGAHPPVASLVVGGRRGGRTALAWPDGAALRGGALELGTDPEPAPDGGEVLLLEEHVLDAQVVDLAGKRLVRVGDVILADDGPRPQLAAVEIGAEAVLRRLGLHRLARRAGAEVLDWHDLHLASAPGHGLALRMPKARVHRLDAAELAELLHHLPPARADELLAAVEEHRRPPPPPPRPARGRRFGRVMRARRRAPS